MQLAWIPAGEYRIGSSDEEIRRLVDVEPMEDFKWLRRSEGPRHRVEVKRPFWMSVNEVTVGNFRRFVEATGYKTEAERDGRIVEGFDQRTVAETSARIQLAGAGQSANRGAPRRLGDLERRRRLLPVA